MDPKHPEDPSSPWHDNPDWVPPDGYQYYGYTWNNGQPSLAPTNTPGSPDYDPNAPSLHQPIPAGGIPGLPPQPGSPADLASQAAPGTTDPTNTGGGSYGGGGGAGPLLPAGQIGSLLQPWAGGSAPPAYIGANNPIVLPGMPNFAKPGEFRAPTGEEVRNTPGYQFGMDEGRRNLEASASARGVENTGGTLEDILKFGQNYADQNYQTALNNSQNIYGLNYLTQFADPNKQLSDKYGYDVNAATGNAGIANASAAGRNTQDWNTWLQQYNIWRNRNLDTTNALYSLGSLGAGVQ